jgi:hypothetical protein
MPLKEILSQFGSEFGIHINIANERAYLVNLINTVARDAYVENDLKNCEREQVFEAGQYDQQIALPQYVDKVIALRYYDTRLPVTQKDMRPRYMMHSWRLPYLGYPYYRWRMKGESPLKRNISNAGLLKFTIAKANSSLFSIVVTGSTINSTRIQEVITFAVGTTEATTINHWQDIETIRKTANTDYNVIVLDVNDNELATIPNSELFSIYKILQVLDRNEYPVMSNLIEVLYKTRFVPFANDYDQFPCGDFYDEVIFWKAAAKYWALRDNTKAIVCENAAENKMIRIAQNKDGPIDVRIKFGKNVVYNFYKNKGASMVTSYFYKNNIADY